MAGFRFVHAADLHLDSPFAGLAGVPDTVRDVLRESTFAALDGLVELAVREKADFVVLAGDLYETADRSLRAQVRLRTAMTRLAESGISAFVVHGNHDPSDGRSPLLDLPENVHVFPAGHAERLAVVLQERGHVADVWGISYPTAAVRDNYARLFRKEAGAPYTIGLLHANVEGAQDHADYAPCTLQDLAAAGLDYWALGHVHTRRVLTERPFAVYPGNPQGRSIRETGPKGCYIVDVDEAGGTRLEFRPLDRVRWEKASVYIEELAEVQALKDKLEQVMEEAARDAGGRPVLLRLELAGRGPLHRLLGGGLAAELLEELRTAETERWGLDAGLGRRTASSGSEDGLSPVQAPPFVWPEALKLRTSPELDWEELERSDGLLGDILRLAGELPANPAALEEFAREALAPMLGNPKAGALLRRTGLAGEAGMDGEAAGEWLRAASVWLAERLTEEE